jgi:hypothetical protein
MFTAALFSTQVPYIAFAVINVVFFLYGILIHYSGSSRIISIFISASLVLVNGIMAASKIIPVSNVFQRAIKNGSFGIPYIYRYVFLQGRYQLNLANCSETTINPDTSNFEWINLGCNHLFRTFYH